MFVYIDVTGQRAPTFPVFCLDDYAAGADLANALELEPDEDMPLGMGTLQRVADDKGAL
jgi:hypothetical protein